MAFFVLIIEARFIFQNMDVAKASERLLKLAVSIIQFPRKQGTGVPCRPEVLNQVAHRAIQPYIYISQYTSIDYFYHFIHKCLFPIIFSRFANCENDHLIHPRTSPFLPVPSCPLAPRIFPRRGRERNIIAPVFSSQPRDPTRIVRHRKSS